MRILERLRPAGEAASKFRTLICTTLLVLLAFTVAQAQNIGGSITGTVTDSSGAAVSGASITVTNIATNAVSKAKTSDTGAFSVQSLPVGTYELHVEQQGFKESVVKNVEVHGSTNTEVNAKLDVGNVSEKVTVEADLVEVQTVGASLGEVVQGTQVRELPLNGENFVGLTQLSPGVSAANDFDSRDKGLQGGVDFSVNGNPYTNNLFLIDGVNNNDVGSNRTILVYPSVDTIAEFKMIRNSFGAEYGQASGAIISITTKSGANQFHGGAFYAGRNDYLDANDWVSNNNGTGKSKLRRNDWGYNISGPVIKDKLFFWWNQEWNREIRGSSFSACVPTALEASGDFSQGVSCGAAVPTIPAQYQAPGNPLKIANPDAAGLLYAQLLPLPNATPAAGSNTNWAYQLANKLNWSEWNVRTDYDITKSERATFRWTQDSWSNPAPTNGNQYWGDTIFPTVAAAWSQPSKSVMGKLSSTLSNSLVNDVEFGYGHNAIITALGGTNPGLVAQIGAAFPTVWPTSVGKDPVALPITWGGLAPYGNGANLWNISPYANHEDLYTIQDNLTKVHGNHTLKAGVFYGNNFKIENGNGGTDRAQFGLGYGATYLTGNSLANLLLPGTGPNPQTFTLSENNINQNARVHWHDFEWYVQDSWKVNRRLTVDYGIRWSFYREPYAVNNEWASFSLADYNPALPSTDACNGVLIVPGTHPCQAAAANLAALGIPLALSNGTPGVNRSLVNNNNHDIAPRIGIAWDVFGNSKTALRMGVGQFFQRELVGMDESLARTAPFVINATVSRPLDTASPLSSPAVSPNAAKDPRGVTPNSWQWNMTIEQQVAKNSTVEIGYVGNVGIHLTSMQDLNQIAPSNWLAGAFVTGGALNALRPAGNFGTIGEFARWGHSTYHSLQALYRAQTGSWGNFQAAYTYSHSIGNVDLDNSSGGINQEAWLYNGNPSLDRGNSNINRPNIFVANEVLYLPKLAGSNGFVKQTLGGWEWNTIAQAEDGTSVSVFSNGVSNSSGGLNALIGSGFNQAQRPLVTGVSCNSRYPGEPQNQFLNPNAFTFVGYTIGSIPSNLAGRGICSGPGNINFDMQFAKSWYVHEKVRIKFSMDMFNIFNHANFIASGSWTNGFSAQGLLCGTPATACSTTNNVVSTYSPTANPTFGQTQNVHPGRELQYTMKITF